MNVYWYWPGKDGLFVLCGLAVRVSRHMVEVTVVLLGFGLELDVQR